MTPKQRRAYAKILRQLMFSAPYESPPLTDCWRAKLANLGAITIDRSTGAPRAVLTQRGQSVALESVAAMLQRNGLADLALLVSATAAAMEGAHLVATLTAAVELAAAPDEQRKDAP